jgi:N-acylneuraminate cytidylyltransferase/CMP-N,N'-diacetyllegionaminic acid synthase
MTSTDSQPGVSGEGRTIVVVPARGGSKRFPRKNIALLAGRPLLAYSIAAAQQARSIDAVYVSTEDDEIAEVAKRYGAQVPFRRPVELAGDQVPADAAVADLVRRLQGEHSLDIDIVVLIQPTSPFVTAAHIDSAVDLLRAEPELDSVTTMAELDHRHHPYNLSFMKADDRWEFLFEEERNQARSRQSKPIALKFGNLFAARTETMLSVGRFGRVKGAVLIDSIYSWDIDHEWELRVAECLLANGLVNLPHIML